jgi:hypothetical protein
MKKVILLITLFLICTTLSAEMSKAQQFFSRDGKKASAGLRAGLNIAHFWGGNDNIRLDGIEAGVYISGFFEYKVHKNVALVGELVFASMKYDATYFELPFIVKAVIPVHKMVDLVLGGGLYASFLTGWDLGNFNNVNGGLVLSPGVEINTKIGIFLADLRYELDFGDAYEQSPFSAFDKIKHGAFTILFGYGVPLPF